MSRKFAKIWKLNPEKLPLRLSIAHSLSLFLLFPPFYIMKISSLSGGLLLRGKFFVLCLVKAQVRSALNRSTWLSSLEKCFSDRNFSSPLSSLFLSLYLLEIDDNLNYFCCWTIFFHKIVARSTALTAAVEEKCEKFYFDRNSFSFCSLTSRGVTIKESFLPLSLSPPPSQYIYLLDLYQC